MIGWFPRLSPNGQNLITSQAGRHGADWIDNAIYVYYAGNGPGVFLSNGEDDWAGWPEPISLSGGGGMFAAEYWSANGYRGVLLSNTLQFDEAYHPALAPDGYLVFLRGHNQPSQELTGFDGHPYDQGPLEYPSASLTGVAWSRYVGGPYKETYYAPRNGTKQRAHASGSGVMEFKPIVVTTPLGDWIATYTHNDVRVYPIGSTFGYSFPSGDARAVDAQWTGSHLRIVWNGPDGTLFDHHQDLAAPRVDLQAPAPPDPPDPPDPPVEPDMDFPPDAWAVVEQMHDRFADMFPETEDGARSWTQMVNEQLAFSFPAGGWCWKKSAQGNPPSKDVAARQIEGRFEGWDLLSAAGETGPRVLATYPPMYHDLAGQVPIAVTPTNHLGAAPPPVQHPYEGGENDTGICDICGKPKADPIHTTQPPPPDDDLEEAVANLEIDMAKAQEDLLDHETRIKALETAAPPPTGGVTAEQVAQMIQMALRAATVDVTVGTNWAHGHPATGKIVP